MRSVSLLTGLVLLVTAAACAPAPSGPDEAAMVAAANALDAQFVEAFNRGDADAVAALYADGPDVVSYPPDTMELRGKAAIREAMAAGFAAMPGARIELVEGNQMVAGDKVIGYGRWRMTLAGPEGALIQPEGRYVDVKTERDGRWVYVLDHASSPIPTLPPPAQPGQGSGS